MRHEEEDVCKCPECGEEIWDLPFASKLAKCWNSEGHASGGTLAFDGEEDIEDAVNTWEPPSELKRRLYRQALEEARECALKFSNVLDYSTRRTDDLFGGGETKC